MDVYVEFLEYLEQRKEQLSRAIKTAFADGSLIFNNSVSQLIRSSLFAQVRLLLSVRLIIDTELVSQATPALTPAFSLCTDWIIHQRSATTE